MGKIFSRLAFTLLFISPLAVYAEGGARGIAILGGYSTGTGLTSTVSSGSSGTYNTSNGAPDVEIVYQRLNAGWGFIAGLSSEFSRTITSITTNGQTVNLGTSNQPTISYILGDISGTYTAGRLYYLLGVNYASATTTGFSSNVTFSGAVGYQAGLGFLMGNHFELQAEYKVINTTVSGGGLTGLSLATPIILLGYHF